LLDLAAAKEGTATLEIVDAADVVIDRYPTTVAIGARLEPLVQALPRHGGTLRNVPVGPDGAFETNGPVRLFLSARAVASQGVLLRASARDVRIDSPQLKLHESRAGGGQPSALVEAPLRATITATGLALTTTFDVDVQPVP
jgi:hypothetical protein